MYNTNEKGYLRADGTIYEIDQIYNKKMLLETQDSFFNKIMTMEHYLLEQSIDIYQTYHSKISDYLLRNNYADFQDYFNQLKVMDKEKLMPWEKSFMDELTELNGIKEDIETLRAKKYVEDENSIEVDEWIRTPEVREYVMKEVAYMKKYQTINILDTILIPTPPATGPSFEERLRLSTGGKIDDFIEEERVAFKKLADSRTPSPITDVNIKDDNLIKKLNILAQVIIVEKPPVIGTSEEELYTSLSEGMYGDISQDHRILRDEIYKVLVLNNKDPQLYSIQFWSKHFKIEPAAIRNIFNYVAFPVVDPQTKAVVKILYFIDYDFITNAQKLTDITRQDYVEYLEEDYYRRIERDNQEMNAALGENTHMRKLFLETPMTQPGFNKNLQLQNAQVY